MRSDVQVVEADDAQVLRNAEAELARGPDHTYRHDIAHCQYRRRPQAILPDAVERGHAAIEGGRPHDDPLVAELDAAQLQTLPVAGQAAQRNRFCWARCVLEQVGRVGWLDADDGELSMPEREQVPGRGSGAHLVVRFDRTVLGERAAVDENHWQARPPDLLDLRAVLPEAHGHESVHRCAADRPDQRAVERRDEEEAVTGPAGGGGDARAQLRVERVGEHDAQQLRGEQPDRHGVPLGEHPRHGMRPVAQIVGHRADPGRRNRVEALGAVESERDGGLGHACLLRHVGDPGAPGPGFHGVLPGFLGPWGSASAGRRLSSHAIRARGPRQRALALGQPWHLPSSRSRGRM